MSDFELIDDLFLLPTPAGAFFAVSGEENEPLRRLLFGLLGSSTSSLATIEQLKQWSQIDDEQTVLEWLYQAQQLHWIEGSKEQTRLQGNSIERDAPLLLQNLSADGRALLADGEGFNLTHTGYADEDAEELSALSADLAVMQQRHRGLLQNNPDLHGGAWAMVDAAGMSTTGVWPLYIGTRRFSLILSGEPRLNREDFTSLVWMLTNRYGR